jgi:hypothetical protein
MLIYAPSLAKQYLMKLNFLASNFVEIFINSSCILVLSMPKIFKTSKPSCVVKIKNELKTPSTKILYSVNFVEKIFFTSEIQQNFHVLETLKSFLRLHLVKYISKLLLLENLYFQSFMAEVLMS